jgi:hypothetical protein
VSIFLAACGLLAIFGPSLGVVLAVEALLRRRDARRSPPVAVGAYRTPATREEDGLAGALEQARAEGRAEERTACLGLARVAYAATGRTEVKAVAEAIEARGAGGAR